MKNYLIIHGHFYQPPREDPETGVIPLQPSAAPYHDWNCRITKECYGANSASRILNGYGEITDIVNNYRYMSFNFGPTLLDWLEVHSPNVYSSILQGDRDSILSNGGHGNAIAQGYNHTILPLDTREDAEIQILWGLENFRRHFGRESEGIWLPETAVNTRTIDLLIDRNISFIILSPWQVEGVREKGEKKWKPLGNTPVPSHRSYYIRGTSGSVAAFFYNPELASGISFGHYLHSADTLYEKLLELYVPDDDSRLLHTATDGEIYGHHEPFGDMCLASLIRKVHAEEHFTISNYGAYLESFPPQTEALLREGEEKRGTSWSCVHGVSRWYKDCGCTTGGEPEWNQKWRTPLRDAFSFLSSTLVTQYKEQMQRITESDPMSILRDYGSVCNGELSPTDFALRYIPGNDHPARTHFLALLEGQRYRLYMFTSCGWFFSEISGLEPVQNMQYALRAINLYREYLLPEDVEKFLQILNQAESNLKEKGTGKDIFLALEDGYPEGFKAALFFCSMYPKHPHIFGRYVLDRLQIRDNETFRVGLTNTATTESFTYDLTFPEITSPSFSISVKNIENPDRPRIIEDLQAVDPDIRANLLNRRIAAAENNYTLGELVFILKYSIFLGAPLPDFFKHRTVELIAGLLKDHLSSSPALIPDTVFNTMCTLIHLADQLQLSFDRTIPQNIIFESLTRLRKSGLEKPGENKGKQIEQIVILCNLMGIYVEDLKVEDLKPVTEASGQPRP